MVIASSVRPWKALSKTITAGRPVATRAILTAFSTASAPEFSSSDFWSAPAARRELGEPAADLHVRLVHADHEALVEVAVDLRVDGVDDGRQVVAEVRAADARRRNRCTRDRRRPRSGRLRPASTTSAGVEMPRATYRARASWTRSVALRSCTDTGDATVYAAFRQVRNAQCGGRACAAPGGRRPIRCRRAAPWPSG